jgi:chromosomal replication initiator protein
LRDIIPVARPKPTTMQVIIRTVAEFYRLSPDELLARGRSRAVALPRQIAMYLAREMTDASLPKIGEAFGGRDHTTVLHAYGKIKEQVERDASFYTLIHELLDKVRAV